jgi:hypothetical protein
MVYTAAPGLALDAVRRSRRGLEDGCCRTVNVRRGHLAWIRCGADSMVRVRCAQLPSPFRSIRSAFSVAWCLATVCTVSTGCQPRDIDREVVLLTTERLMMDLPEARPMALWPY